MVGSGKAHQNVSSHGHDNHHTDSGQRPRVGETYHVHAVALPSATSAARATQSHEPNASTVDSSTGVPRKHKDMRTSGDDHRNVLETAKGLWRALNTQKNLKFQNQQLSEEKRLRPALTGLKSLKLIPKQLKLINIDIDRFI